ncbi:hypothetical protein [Bradyrhizobium canariense]|uniref:hypothetical protein n=1 Tax=Bradyrhizobium canariense TaxID=255045 RepID=UPI003D9B88D3
MANSRQVSLSDGKVRFAWKVYRQDSKTKLMTLDADEFFRVSGYMFCRTASLHSLLRLCCQWQAKRQPRCLPVDRCPMTCR